jgi:hypothetical protein
MADTFDIAVDADDGSGYRQSGDWASIASGTFTDLVFGRDDIVSVSRTTNAGNFFISNAFLRFDTSSLPDGATITAANLKLYIDGAGAPDGATFGVDYYDFGGEPSVAADWEQTSAGDAISSISPGSLTTGVVNTLALTGLTGISKTGITGFRIAPKESTAPSGDNFIDIAAREHATGAPAQLVVTYTAGGTDATVTGVVAAATASQVAPPKPRPAAPFSEVNLRM